MPLLGSAAMLLSFDVTREAIAEHDEWHTHEHLAERLRLPGFLRGTRWVAFRGHPRYLVVYEVAELAALTSAAYLERLNSPSAWTTRMMPNYRDMRRAFCTVSGSFGFGTGHIAVLLRFKPEPGSADALRSWLLQDVLPQLPSKPGIGSVHLLEGAGAPEMTNEQRLRGADAGVSWALLLTGYSEEPLSGLVENVLGPSRLERRGAPGALEGRYRIDYSLVHGELDV